MGYTARHPQAPCRANERIAEADRDNIDIWKS